MCVDARKPSRYPIFSCKSADLVESLSDREHSSDKSRLSFRSRLRDERGVSLCLRDVPSQTKGPARHHRKNVSDFIRCFRVALLPKNIRIL